MVAGDQPLLSRHAGAARAIERSQVSIWQCMLTRSGCWLRHNMNSLPHGRFAHDHGTMQNSMPYASGPQAVPAARKPPPTAMHCNRQPACRTQCRTSDVRHKIDTATKISKPCVSAASPTAGLPAPTCRSGCIRTPFRRRNPRSSSPPCCRTRPACTRGRSHGGPGRGAQGVGWGQGRG